MVIRCLIFTTLVKVNKKVCTAGMTTLNTRMNCGKTMWYGNDIIYETAENECNAKGCCWDDTVPNVPFCFYADGGKVLDIKFIMLYIMVLNH